MSSKTKTTAMKEEATSALVPKLRFPEFRGAEGWRKEALGDLMEITSSKRVHESDWAEAGVPFYRAREIVALNNGEPITPLFISEDLYRENAKRSGEIVPGDLLVSGVGSIGIPYLVKPNDRFYFKDGNIIWLKNRGTKLQGQFLLTLYGTQFVQSQIKTMAGVGTVGTYTIDNANKTVVVFPVDDIEQQKVAECLSSVDALMAAQARKVDALKTHKKGLMQQLFPREGETQPRLRFPEFQNTGEWVDQSIGDFGKVVTGSTPSTAQPAFYGGGIPFVSPADISDMRFVDQAKNTLTAEGFAETRHIKAGSVLFVCIGSTIGKVAQNVHDCATNQQINAVVPSSKHSKGFVYFALSFASERIALLAGRQAVPIINKSLFSSVRILAPKLPEQEGIASCLSSLDALIAAETQKLEALKTHKKGLMQQLFPSLEQVSP